MAPHYGTAILPTRVRRPSQGGKWHGILHAERRIIAKLRNRQFFTLVQLNEAIAAQSDEFGRAIRTIPATKYERFRPGRSASDAG
jgi:hypothetical protein